MRILLHLPITSYLNTLLLCRIIYKQQSALILPSNQNMTNLRSTMLALMDTTQNPKQERGVNASNLRTLFRIEPSHSVLRIWARICSTRKADALLMFCPNLRIFPIQALQPTSSQPLDLQLVQKSMSIQKYIIPRTYYLALCGSKRIQTNFQGLHFLCLHTTRLHLDYLSVKNHPYIYYSHMLAYTKQKSLTLNPRLFQGIRSAGQPTGRPARSLRITS